MPIIFKTWLSSSYSSKDSSDELTIFNPPSIIFNPSILNSSLVFCTAALIEDAVKANFAISSLVPNSNGIGLIAKRSFSLG